jgi:hypothetical protein
VSIARNTRRIKLKLIQRKNGQQNAGTWVTAKNSLLCCIICLNTNQTKEPESVTSCSYSHVAKTLTFHHPTNEHRPSTHTTPAFYCDNIESWQEGMSCAFHQHSPFSTHAFCPLNMCVHMYTDLCVQACIHIYM